MRERGECEITPSTDVRYPPGSTDSRKNHWLLIGKQSQKEEKLCPVQFKLKSVSFYSTDKELAETLVQL